MHNTRSINSFVVLQSRSNLKAICLAIQRVKLWNSLTETMKMSNNSHAFQKQPNRYLKLLSKLIRNLRITFCYTQLCSRCLVNMTPVVNVVIHYVFALLSAIYISGYYNL